MTFAAAKLVQVQIFVSIGKVIAKKNGNNENLHAARPPTRPTNRPPARKKGSLILLKIGSVVVQDK